MKIANLFSKIFLLFVLFLCLAGTGLSQTLPGTVSGEGTHFEITDSDYLNITLDSAEPVMASLSSFPETIRMQVDSASAATQTQMALSGLLPNTEYYQYEDPTEPPLVITSDTNGQYSFPLDLTTTRYIMIKSNPDAPDAVPIPGSQTGTAFQVTDSEYLNVTVSSSETIRLGLESVPEVITMDIEGTTEAVSTDITICGLLPVSTYYKYEDNFHNLTELITDAAGCYSYTQDISNAHIIFIQTTRSTKYIKDDATGGDCASIGSWDNTTKTCTLTTDLNQTIQLDSNNITLDGNGHSLIGPGNSGVYGWQRNGVTIKNLNITNFTFGVNITTVTCSHWSCSSSGVPLHNNTIINNNISNVYHGIDIDSWSRYWTNYGYNNVISGNTVTNASGGISIIHGVRTKIENNILQGKGNLSAIWQYTGVRVSEGGSLVSNNTITGFGRGIYVYYPDGWAGFNGYANTIENNLIDDNNYGIVSYLNWGRSVTRNNTISHNSTGYVIQDKCSFEFYSNNFLNNSRQILHSVPHWSSVSFSGNYWSHYDTPEEGCYDNNSNGYCDAALYLYTDRGYANYDNYPRTDLVSGTPLPPGYNEPPIADAGPDQTVEATGPEGALVTLVGSGSSDPDGDALTYNWTGIFGTANGVGPTVLIPAGTYTVTLTVDDGNGGTGEDTVNITVLPDNPPVTDAGPDQTIQCPATQSVSVTLDGSGSSDPDGDELSYSWTGPFGTATGVSPSVTLPEWGTWTIPLTVDDGRGETDTDTVGITVGDTIPPVTTASVIGVKGANGWYTSEVTITLTSTDSCTGVKEIHYTINGAQTVVPGDTAVITLTDDGTYTITYWAVDNAGVQSATGTTHVNTAVTTPGPGTGGGGYYTACVNVTLEDIDGSGEQLYYSLDGINYLPYTGEFAVCQEATATVSYGYRAPSGNVEQPKTLIIKIDLNPPGITCPADITVEQESFDGTARTSTQLDAFFGSVTATDTVDGSPEISDNAPSVFPAGATAVTFTATDTAGHTADCQASVTVEDTTPPFVYAGSDFSHSADLDGTHTVTLDQASVLDVADPAPSLAWTEDGITLGSGLVLTHSFGIGEHLLTLTATDASGNSASDSVLVTITKRETLVRYIGDMSGTYSDPFVFEAEVLDVTPDDPVNGAGRTMEGVTVTFDISALVTLTAISDAGGIAGITTPWNWPGLPAGSHSLTASYEGDAVFDSASDAAALSIDPEAVSMDYTGDQVVTIGAAEAYLRATVVQPDDGGPVDYVQRPVEVVFELFHFTDDMSVDQPLLTVSAFLVDAGSGVATAATSITNPGEGLYTLRISLADHGYVSTPAEEATLTVFDPDGQFFTGGGWVAEEGSAEHQNFGFTFRFNANEMPKGNIVYLKRSPDRLWRIKSNSLTGAGFVDFATAQAQGGCNLQSVDRLTGEVIPEESLGNLDFFLEVVDGTMNGTGVDTFLLEIRDGNGLPVEGFFMSAPMPLQGGKIQIHGQ